jgi:hypothetical protein
MSLSAVPFGLKRHALCPEHFLQEQKSFGHEGGFLYAVGSVRILVLAHSCHNEISPSLFPHRVPPQPQARPHPFNPIAGCIARVFAELLMRALVEHAVAHNFRPLRGSRPASVSRFSFLVVVDKQKLDQGRLRDRFRTIHTSLRRLMRADARWVEMHLLCRRDTLGSRSGTTPGQTCLACK